MKEAFSLDGLRATPNALYYKHHTLQEEYARQEEMESNPVKDAF